MSHLRAEYKLRQEGKKSRLNDERIAELEAVGFAWNASINSTTEKKKRVDAAAAAAAAVVVPNTENPSEDTVWALRIEQLKVFKSLTGHCLVPKVCSANPELGRVSRNM